MKAKRITMLQTGLKPANLGKVKPVTATERIKGNSWLAIKRRFERDNPRICAECTREGRVGPGHELDHIVPLHLGGSNAEANLQWLCRSHHEAKSAREDEERRGGGPTL